MVLRTLQKKWSALRHALKNGHAVLAIEAGLGLTGEVDLLARYPDALLAASVGVSVRCGNPIRACIVLGVACAKAALKYVDLGLRLEVRGRKYIELAAAMAEQVGRCPHCSFVFSWAAAAGALGSAYWGSVWCLALSSPLFFAH